jgi:putative membrane protein
MRGLAVLLIVFVAVLQTSFLILEMFLLETPIGLKTFDVSAEDAATMATLAKNQGLYNGFLAAGLLWGLSQGFDRGRPIVQFFLGCVAVAGLYGGATAGKMIWGVQMLPALLALGAVLLAARTRTATRPRYARA